MTAIKPRSLHQYLVLRFVHQEKDRLFVLQQFALAQINAPDFNNIERFCASAELLTPVIWKLELKRP